MEIVFDYSRKDGPSAARREQERVDQLLACLQTYVGHELPNQLVPIQAFARLLLEQHAAQLDEEGRLLLDRLAFLTQQADTLARRLAEIGRLLRQPPWGRSLSLDDLVGEAMAEVQALGCPAGISWEMQPGLPAIAVSRRLLYQVLVQLLRNAAQAMAGLRGAVAISARRVVNPG